MASETENTARRGRQVTVKRQSVHAAKQNGVRLHYGPALKSTIA